MAESDSKWQLMWARMGAAGRIDAELVAKGWDRDEQHIVCVRRTPDALVTELLADANRGAQADLILAEEDRSAILAGSTATYERAVAAERELEELKARQPPELPADVKDLQTAITQLKIEVEAQRLRADRAELAVRVTSAVEDERQEAWATAQSHPKEIVYAKEIVRLNEALDRARETGKLMDKRIERLTKRAETAEARRHALAVTLGRILARETMADLDATGADYLGIVFDGPPGPISGRSVEVESPAGTGVSIGTWMDRGDGYWALRIPHATAPSAANDLGPDAPLRVRVVGRRGEEECRAAVTHGDTVFFPPVLLGRDHLANLRSLVRAYNHMHGEDTAEDHALDEALAEVSSALRERAAHAAAVRIAEATQAPADNTRLARRLIASIIVRELEREEERLGEEEEAR